MCLQWDFQIPPMRYPPVDIMVGAIKFMEVPVFLGLLPTWTSMSEHPHSVVHPANKEFIMSAVSYY